MTPRMPKIYTKHQKPALTDEERWAIADAKEALKNLKKEQAKQPKKDPPTPHEERWAIADAKEAAKNLKEELKQAKKSSVQRKVDSIHAQMERLRQAKPEPGQAKEPGQANEDDIPTDEEDN